MTTKDTQDGSDSDTSSYDSTNYYDNPYTKKRFNSNFTSERIKRLDSRIFSSDTITDYAIFNIFFYFIVLPMFAFVWILIYYVLFGIFIRPVILGFKSLF